MEVPLLQTIILAISSFSLLDDLNPANYIFLLIYVHSSVIFPILYPMDHISVRNANVWKGSLNSYI